MSGLEWRQQARCLGEDPELWFTSDPLTEAAAQAICQECPVRHDCLEDALTRRDYWGVWGATTGDERRTLNNRRRR